MEISYNELLKKPKFDFYLNEYFQDLKIYRAFFRLHEYREIEA